MNEFIGRFCILIAPTELSSRTEEEKKEEGEVGKSFWDANVLNLIAESCKRKRKRGLIFVVTELAGLPVTVASLAYWQTQTLQTLVCIFHRFACQRASEQETVCLHPRNLIHDRIFSIQLLSVCWFQMFLFTWHWSCLIEYHVSARLPNELSELSDRASHAKQWHFSSPRACSTDTTYLLWGSSALK